MISSSTPKPPKPPPPPELPAQLVDPAVKRAAMFARVGGWSGFAGTRVAGRWKGRSLALRVLRPGQTGFLNRKQALVAGGTSGGLPVLAPSGPKTAVKPAGPVSTAGGKTHVVVKPPTRGVASSGGGRR